MCAGYIRENGIHVELFRGCNNLIILRCLIVLSMNMRKIFLGNTGVPSQPSGSAAVQANMHARHFKFSRNRLRGMPPQNLADISHETHCTITAGGLHSESDLFHFVLLAHPGNRTRRFQE